MLIFLAKKVYFYDRFYNFDKKEGKLRNS